MATVPIFAPDGSLGDIPAGQLAAAVKAGAKPGVHVTAPDGSAGVIPADRMPDAVKAGAKVIPFEDQPAKSFWGEAAKGLWNDIKSIPNALMSPDPLADPRVSDADKWKIYEKQSAAAQAKNAQRAQQHGQAYSLGASANEMMGVNVAGEEQAAEEGNPGGVVGHAAAVPAMAATAEGLGAGVSALADTDAAAGVIGKVKNVTPKQIAQTVGGTTGAVAGHGPLSIPSAYAGAEGAGRLTQAILGKERANSPVFAKKPVFPGAPLPEHPGTFPGAPLPATPAPEVLNPSLVSEARTLPGQVAPETIRPEIPPTAQAIPARAGLALPAAPEFPGAPLPEAPAPELLQARGLEQGGHAPAKEPAAALADLPVHAVHKAIQELGPQASVADVTTRANQIAKLGDLLNNAVGGKPLKPNVPLKNQLDVPAQTAAADVPEGHTPVDSSALKSYKYDPNTKEFETVTPSGGHYIYGDVSPEQVQAFEAADSKGKAWNDIRKNSTLVAKVVNGKRVAVRPPAELQTAAPESSEVPQESVVNTKKYRR